LSSLAAWEGQGHIGSREETQSQNLNATGACLSAEVLVTGARIYKVTIVGVTGKRRYGESSSNSETRQKKAERIERIEHEHFQYARKRECERLLREGERVSSSLENIEVVVKAMFPVKRGEYKVVTGKRKRGTKSELKKQIIKTAREMHIAFQMRPGGDYETMQYPPVLYKDEYLQNLQLGRFLGKTKKQSPPAFQFFMDYGKRLVQNTEWYESKTW
jgi:hypothetical protein